MNLKAKIESKNQRQKDFKAKLNAETFFRQRGRQEGIGRGRHIGK